MPPLWRLMNGMTLLDQQAQPRRMSSLTDLTNGVTYIFQVRAVNANSGDASRGSASNTAEATPAGPLDEPLDVVAEAGHRRVTLSWTRIPDADGSMEDQSVIGYQYRQRVGTGGWGGWTTIAASDLVESGTNNETRSYTVTGLANGTEYRFQVRGRNSVGGGAASIEVMATPIGGQPSAPRNLRPTAGDRQVSLSWTAPSDNGGEPIIRLRVQVRTPHGQRRHRPVAGVDRHRRHADDSDCLQHRRWHELHQRRDLLFHGASGERRWVVVLPMTASLRPGVPRSIRRAVRPAQATHRRPHFGG